MYMKPIYLYSILFWLLLAVVAIINGIVRNSVYRQYVGDLAAHHISTAIFISVMFGLMYVFFKKSGLEYSNSDLIPIGVGLLIGTIAFEFIAGHYVFGNSWEKLLADYNIFRGRVWSLVLLALLFGPWIIGRK